MQQQKDNEYSAGTLRTLVHPTSVIDVAYKLSPDTESKTAQSLILQLGDVTYDLVDLHFPKINTTVARDWFYYSRPYRKTSPIVMNRNNNLEHQTNQNNNEK